MILVGRYDSPYVRRVGVSLHALGLWFEHLSLSPFSQAKELRKFTSIGRMPALVLDNGETLIESAAILDHLDEVVGPSRALIPAAGAGRRNSLRILAAATAACDKAIAINYERRRPAEMVSVDWVARCRIQLEAALSELQTLGLQLADVRPLKQTDITVGCMFAYVKRVAPDVGPAGRYLGPAGRYPCLDLLSLACEARHEFIACPQ
jgi:glutathione S-transferase